MARPKKDGLDYFPHDVYASSDPKIEPLILLYGAAGYAFFFLHLEYIYRNPELVFNISDAETREVICQKLKISMDNYNAILQTAIKHGCFDKQAFEQQGVLTSNGVRKRASVVTDKRKKMQKYYESKNNEVSVSETGEETTPETPQSKVKESKVNKSKVKESKQKESSCYINSTNNETPEHFYSDNIAPITQFVADDIKNLIEDGFEESFILRMMQEAVKNEKRNWKYISAALNNNGNKGIKTLEQYETHEAERQRNKGQTDKQYQRAATFDDIE